MKHLNILIRLCLVLAIFSAVTGCTSHAGGPIFTPVTDSPPDMSVVYIYRRFKFVGGGARYSFWGNDQRLGLMGSSGYYVHLTNERRVKYTAVARGWYGEWTEMFHFTDNLIEIDLEPGETYYLRWNVGFEVTLKQVPDNVGMGEIKKLRLIDDRNQQD